MVTAATIETTIAGTRGIAPTRWGATVWTKSVPTPIGVP